jgi:uncharacterized damage-inducible protein DinB
MSSDEAVQIASVLDKIGHGVLVELQGISDEDLNRPMTLPETNTLFALATHLVGAGEFWVLVLAGGRIIPRDRPAEFRASGSLSDLTARYELWISGVHEVLDGLASDKMEQRIELSRYRSAPSPSEEVSVREALLHAVEHSALHLGQIQITRQLLGYPPPSED